MQSIIKNTIINLQLASYSPRTVEAYSYHVKKFIERIGDEWSTPKPLCLEINSDHLHWQVSIDLQGNVYFGSERSGSKGKDDIFVSRYIDGRYSHPVSIN